jgi:DNA-binding transcriptional MerR regulator
MSVAQTQIETRIHFPETAVLVAIGPAARRLGVTSRTLRHYEDIGLIQSQRDGRDVRLYAEDAIEALQTIVLLRGVDVPIAAIRQVMAQRDDADAFVQAIRDALSSALQTSESRGNAIRRLIRDIEQPARPSRTAHSK